MSIKFIPEVINPLYPTDIIFYPFQGDENVAYMFNHVYNTSGTKDQGPYPDFNEYIRDRFIIPIKKNDEEQVIEYAKPVIIVEWCDPEEESLIKVFMNYGIGSIDKPLPGFNEPTYRDEGSVPMMKLGRWLKNELQRICRVERAISSFGEIEVYYYTKKWSFDEYNRIVDEIQKLRVPNELIELYRK